MKLQQRLLDTLREILTVRELGGEYIVLGRTQDYYISAPVLAMLAHEIESQTQGETNE